MWPPENTNPWLSQAEVDALEDGTRVEVIWSDKYSMFGHSHGPHTFFVHNSHAHSHFPLWDGTEECVYAGPLDNVGAEPRNNRVRLALPELHAPK